MVTCTTITITIMITLNRRLIELSAFGRIWVSIHDCGLDKGELVIALVAGDVSQTLGAYLATTYKRSLDRDDDMKWYLGPLIDTPASPLHR